MLALVLTHAHSAEPLSLPLTIALLILVSGLIAMVGLVMRRGPHISLESPRGERKPLPVLDQKCSNCVHWDLADGQATMARFPAFQGAAEALSPAEMAHGVQVNEDGIRMGSKCTDPKIKALMWKDFGACTHPDVMELRSKHDSCVNFAAKDV